MCLQVLEEDSDGEVENEEEEGPGGGAESEAGSRAAFSGAASIPGSFSMGTGNQALNKSFNMGRSSQVRLPACFACVLVRSHPRSAGVRSGEIRCGCGRETYMFWEANKCVVGRTLMWGR